MLNIMDDFNRAFNNDPTMIKKALSTAVGVGGALIPEQLEKIITNTIQRLSPELALMTGIKIAGNVHSYNKLTKLPQRGSAIGESATTTATNSNFTRATATLKEYRRKGSVTDFLQDSSSDYVDSSAAEFENQLLQMIYDLVYYNTFGNADANAYEHDGWEKLIQTNRSHASGAISSLKTIDDMIDKSNRYGGAPHRRAILMSPEMKSSFSRLLTNVRLNNGVTGSGLTQISINGGWRMDAYRDIPLLESTSMRPTETFSSTITAAGVSTGGSLSNGTFYYSIAPVTHFGEQVASTEASITLSGGTATQRIRFSLDAAHTDADGVETAYAYKIYASQTSGALKLVKVVSAFIYDSNGKPDTGQNMVGTDYVYVTSLTPGSDVPTSMQSDVPLRYTGSIPMENIALIDLHPFQGLGKLVYTNQGGSQFKGLITTEPLAKIDASRDFLMRSDCVLVPSFEKTSVWVRGLRSE